VAFELFSSIPSFIPQVGAKYTQTATAISGTPATIVWTNTVFQVGPGSMSNGTYTVGSAGFYYLIARVRIGGTFSNNDSVNLQIQVNGSSISLGLTRAFTGQSDQTATCSNLYNLSVNDAVIVQWASGGTSLANQNNSADTYFSLVQIA